MVARVEGMPRETLEQGAPWDWNSFGDYLGRLEGKLGLNAGFYVGHSAVRRAVMGERSLYHWSTEEELARKQEELREGQAEHLKVLEEISGLTRAEAERRLFSDLESELESRLGQMVRDMILEAEERADVEARRLISTTMERLA